MVFIIYADFNNNNNMSSMGTRLSIREVIEVQMQQQSDLKSHSGAET